jgi:hypothetical protein
MISDFMDEGMWFLKVLNVENLSYGVLYSGYRAEKSHFLADFMTLI